MCTFVQVRIETLTPKTSPYALVVQLQASAAWDVGRGTVTDSDTARESRVMVMVMVMVLNSAYTGPLRFTCATYASVAPAGAVLRSSASRAPLRSRSRSAEPRQPPDEIPLLWSLTALLHFLPSSSY